MFTVFLIIYLLTLFLCFSSYIFYPVVIWVMGKTAPFKVRRGDIEPYVSVIIPAYNEMRNIERKIENTLSLDYPEDKVEILVGSDGSTDATADLARKYTDRGIHLVDFQTNRGKTTVQNDLVTQSKGDILIFTDAASFVQSDAVRKIIGNFADDRVGCVCGRMRFANSDGTITSNGQGVYWQYEVKIRELESKLGSLIGVDGPLYAVRRDCYIPLEANMISDLLSPLLVLERGKRVVLESEAVVDEDPTLRTNEEFKTRRRITLRALIGLSAHSRLLNPLENPLLALQLFFHKVLRWFVGPLLLLNAFSCLPLSWHPFFKFVLTLYVFLILAASLGWIAARVGIKASALTVPYYFSLVNFAATMGIIDFFRKEQAVTWTPIRH